jgi:hypothetical protein
MLLLFTFIESLLAATTLYANSHPFGLDTTLIRSDSFQESLLQLQRAHPKELIHFSNDPYA